MIDKTQLTGLSLISFFSISIFYIKELGSNHMKLFINRQNTKKRQERKKKGLRLSFAQRSRPVQNNTNYYNHCLTKIHICETNNPIYFVLLKFQPYEWPL